MGISFPHPSEYKEILIPALDLANAEERYNSENKRNYIYLEYRGEEIRIYQNELSKKDYEYLLRYLQGVKFSNHTNLV